MGAFSIRGANVSVRRHSNGIPGDPGTIRVGAGLRCAGASGEAEQFTFKDYALPGDASRNEIVHAIRVVVREALMHEVDEFLRVDGALVTNPHPEAGARETWSAA